MSLEVDILEAVLDLRESGRQEVHGFALAERLRERVGARSLTAHGTLYKALGRLEEFGLLTSRWEADAIDGGRPRRRLYELAPAGVQVAQSARSAATQHADAPRARSYPELA